MSEKINPEGSISVEDLTFSFNWNNKLSAMAFTTLRLSGKKYVKGKRMRVLLKGKPLGTVVIQETKELYLHDLNEFIARLDTGYSKAECEKIILRMYQRVDFTKQKLVLVLCVYENYLMKEK